MTGDVAYMCEAVVGWINEAPWSAAASLPLSVLWQSFNPRAAKESKMAASKKVARKAAGAGQPTEKDTRLPPVIGALKTSQAAERIEAMGDARGAARLRKALEEVGRDVRFSRLINFRGDTPVYAYTEHSFGFIVPPRPGASGNLEIVDAGNMEADDGLKNQRIKVSLDRLRVFDYPGKGEHTVLIDFYGRHQTSTPNQTEDLHFTQKYRALEGTGGGLRGLDIFVGLKVGEQGVSFKCYTVNVENKDDKKLLAFLDSDVFKKGLGMIEAFNPAIPIVSGLATGVLKMFAGRNDNVPVQDFHLGLDFSKGGTGARLREGSYVAVQVPNEADWDWSQWVLNRANNQVVSKEGSNAIKLNYIVFRIDKM
jgi:hypothetical protein